ncbi:hypothetical protein Nham_0825 [Nitrobacter hamburgensis X14]|uniref:DUF4157 domain-containing protein n=1 Tax=Nitrobacter hamburgensis (strain DSM 10229 / NCIMB 13809 / X14) TaxID=323097 RepID=Q1QPZ6_NITHX|nr:polymorphic toxin type 5 domain-containing protein [Nitrobacter hamburgensis]ABE61701.1 hypothetical protein Nham_0825 [Nitrobacter hamburgensis X14]
MSAHRALAVKAAPAVQTAAPVTLQRTCACEETGEKCPRCAGKRTRLQRFGTGAPPLALPGAVGDVLRSPGQPMPRALRTRMEEKFGQDFSAVRMHADASAQNSAAAVNARAYTVGRDVVFASSAPDLVSTAGQRLLGHELAHVVQQSRGGVAAGIDPDPALEAEAKRAGDAIAAGHPASAGRAAPVGLQRDAEQPDYPAMEKVTGYVAQALGFNETTSRVVAASLEGGMSGFSHQWNEGKTGERLGKKFKSFSITDVPDLIKGYLVGVFEGVVSPITDLFAIGVMVEQLNAFVTNLVSSAISKAAELANELKGLVDVLAGLGKPIKEFFLGLKSNARETFKMLVGMLNSNGGLVEKAIGFARSIGRTQGAAVAKSLESPWEEKTKQPEEKPAGALGYVSNLFGQGRDALIETPWAKVGNKAGYALGFALIQVVLLVFSEGIGNLITQIGRSLGGLAKAGTFLGRTIEGVTKFVTMAGGIITKVEEAVNAVVQFLLKPMMPVLEPLLKPLAGMMERMGGFLRKLFGIAEKDAAQVATTAATKALGGAHPAPPAPHLPTPATRHPHGPPAKAPVPHGEPHPTPKPVAEPRPAAKATEPHPKPAAKAPEPAAATPAAKTAEPHPQAMAPEPHKPEPKAPHSASDAAHKPIAEPEPVGGGHHVQTTPDGFELCSGPPCPNLRLMYKEQLAADDALRAEMETLEAKRKLAAKLEADGIPDRNFAKGLNKEAAKLQQKLETAKLHGPTAPKPPPAKPPVAPAPIRGSAKPAPGEALVGSSTSQMRRRSAKLIASDPDHPLGFLLNKRGRFRSQRGLKHHELMERPDIVQMGHIRSNKLGEDEFVMLQGGWENQFNNVTIEMSHIRGAVLDQPAVSIGGVVVDLKTAQYWENVGLLKRGTVACSPRVQLPISDIAK